MHVVCAAKKLIKKSFEILLRFKYDLIRRSGKLASIHHLTMLESREKSNKTRTFFDVEQNAKQNEICEHKICVSLAKFLSSTCSLWLNRISSTLLFVFCFTTAIFNFAMSRSKGKYLHSFSSFSLRYLTSHAFLDHYSLISFFPILKICGKNNEKTEFSHSLDKNTICIEMNSFLVGGMFERSPESGQ